MALRCPPRPTRQASCSVRLPTRRKTRTVKRTTREAQPPLLRLYRDAHRRAREAGSIVHVASARGGSDSNNDATEIGRASYRRTACSPTNTMKTRQSMWVIHHSISRGNPQKSVQRKRCNTMIVVEWSRTRRAGSKKGKDIVHERVATVQEKIDFQEMVDPSKRSLKEQEEGEKREVPMIARLVVAYQRHCRQPINNTIKTGSNEAAVLLIARGNCARLCLECRE